MANYQNLLNSIANVITTNNNNEITGAIMKSTLQSIVSVMGANATFGGVAHPTDNPGTPDGSVVYIASEAGTYTNFGAISVADNELAVLLWNSSSWNKYVFAHGGVYVDSISDVDFAVTDDDGNVLVYFENGHIKTKNFDSETDRIPILDEPDADLDFADEDGNVLVRFADGHIKTKNFDSRDIPPYQSTGIEYEGERVTLSNKMGYENFGNLTISNVQSFAQYGDIFVCIDNSSNYYVYNISNPNSITLLNSAALTYTGTTSPHGNMSSFSGVFYNSNTIPLIYISQWDGDKGVIAYNINSSNALVQMQVIKPSSALKASSTFGLGNSDFIVDAENGILYSVVYKKNSWAEDVENLTCICAFSLPSLSDGTMVELNESDILWSFEVENIPTRQDASVLNNKLFIANGYVTPYYAPYLRVINLLSKSIVAKIPLKSIYDYEPEGVEATEDHVKLIFNGKSEIKKLTF